MVRMNIDCGQATDLTGSRAGASAAEVLAFVSLVPFFCGGGFGFLTALSRLNSLRTCAMPAVHVNAKYARPPLQPAFVSACTGQFPHSTQFGDTLMLCMCWITFMRQ